jgi:hypothetical protein
MYQWICVGALRTISHAFFRFCGRGSGIPQYNENYQPCVIGTYGEFMHINRIAQCIENYRADKLLVISDFEQSPSEGFEELEAEVWCVS